MGKYCSFFKLLFCKEKHQTQPTELKCLAHEICVCGGRMLWQCLHLVKRILSSVVDALLRKPFLLM